MIKNRKILKSIGFDEFQLDSIEIIQAKEGESFNEHVRRAVDKYLANKGIIRE